MDGETKRWIDQWIDKLPSYTDTEDASENGNFPTNFAILTKALSKDGRTDVPSCRDAIAASKNMSVFMV